MSTPTILALLALVVALAALVKESSVTSAGLTFLALLFLIAPYIK